jgi:hypothetical protein
MIVNGGSIKCGGRCENVRLQIGHYHLKSHMFPIEMGECDIVLGVEWLRTLGPILMDFKELTMQFQEEGQTYHFQGLTASSHEIICFHHMENLLKKGHSAIIAQLHSIHAVETPFVHPNLQAILSKHQLFFPLLKGFRLLVVFMIIPYPLFLAVFLPMFSLIVIPLPKRMKLRKSCRNCYKRVLSALVLALILLLWSWYLRKKVPGACVLIFVPSIN